MTVVEVRGVAERDKSLKNEDGSLRLMPNEL